MIFFFCKLILWSKNEVAKSKELTRLATLNPCKRVKGDGRIMKDGFLFEYSFRCIAMRQVGGTMGAFESNVSKTM